MPGLMRRFPVEFPSLETDQLTLRQVRIADLDRLRAIYGDPQVMRHASDPVFARAEHYVQTIEGMARGFSADQAVEWGMARRSDDVLIGTVGLHNFRETVAEVGCLLAAAYWRQGFMREAVGAVQAFAKERLGLARLEADIDAGNTASLALFGALGYTVAERTSEQAALLLTKRL
ncbi:GNAT family N-acetyltransferase [Xanthomonas translucens]|uniref:GNAT family N-acetyltransferase n=1 Tax=Xanthomonas campestris pv. translucens TaxID=343 RepID=UPI00272B14AB|nr:GNAT family N-acetyltransferase [Xanthomonas translucens]WLA11796.1 GNAT family N-acetyltransferase [Xanthomonas translucens]